MMKNDNTKRLPDAEFTVMKAIWQFEAPIGIHTIMSLLGDENKWKTYKLLAALAKLAEKGFLSSARIGTERCYTAIISEREYLDVEVGGFLQHYLKNPLTRLVRI